MRRLLNVLWVAVMLLGVSSRPVEAQPIDAQPADGYSFGRSIGGQVAVTNSGFGVGAHFRMLLGRSTVFAAEMGLGAVKDAREATFFDRFDRQDIPNKSHYLLLLPFQVGVERRMFERQIEDNFRPFILAMVGPTLGWVSPYFDDVNGNGLLDGEESTLDAVSAMSMGRAHVGIGARIAVGVHWGLASRSTQGVRIGYSFARFSQPIQLLEAGIQPPRRVFGTPEIQLYFARLW